MNSFPSQSGPYLFKAADICIVTKHSLPFQVCSLFIYKLKKHNSTLIQIPRTITVRKDSPLRTVVAVDVVGWLLGEWNVKKKVSTFLFYLC